jgi:hypothetical protein
MDLGDKDDVRQRVTVLLAEYNTLRTEVISARTAFARAIEVTVAVIMAAVGLGFSKTFEGSPNVPIGIGIGAVAYLILTFLWNELNTQGYTRRLRTLERDINRRLGGEELLLWETKHGWGSLVIPWRRYKDEPPRT